MSEPTTTTVGSPDYSRSFFGHPRGLATLLHDRVLRAIHLLRPAGDAACCFSRHPQPAQTRASASMAQRLARCMRCSRARRICAASREAGSRTVCSGQRSAVFTGGVFIAIGNFILAIPATPAVFYMGLAVVVLGIGLLKPNVSSVVGALYEGQAGARRDAGFSIFYMGINLGAAARTIHCGRPGRRLELAPRVSHLRLSPCSSDSLSSR